MTNTLFQNILPEDIPVMLKRLNAYTKSYQKEEYIKHAGDPADFIGIIESGSVHILQDDYYGNRNITASIPPDSLFGEAFACAGIPYLPVDIVAAEDCTVMFLFDLLIAIFHGELFTAIDCFYGFLCKFINIHNRSPPHIRLCNLQLFRAIKYCLSFVDCSHS